jgi:hypothetical protein
MKPFCCFPATLHVNAGQQRCLARFIYMNRVVQPASEQVQPPALISDAKIGHEPIDQISWARQSVPELS